MRLDEAASSWSTSTSTWSARSPSASRRWPRTSSVWSPGMVRISTSIDTRSGITLVLPRPSATLGEKVVWVQACKCPAIPGLGRAARNSSIRSVSRSCSRSSSSRAMASTWPLHSSWKRAGGR